MRTQPLLPHPQGTAAPLALQGPLVPPCPPSQDRYHHPQLAPVPPEAADFGGSGHALAGDSCPHRWTLGGAEREIAPGEGVCKCWGAGDPHCGDTEPWGIPMSSPAWGAPVLWDLGLGVLGSGFGDLGSAVLGVFSEGLQCLEARGALGSVFWGSAILRHLWCSGVSGAQGSALFGICIFWGLQCLGSVLLEGLCSSGLRVAPGSGFCLFPASISAIPAPSFLLQSPSPSPRGASSSPFPPPDTPDHPSDVTSRRDPPRH